MVAVLLVVRPIFCVVICVSLLAPTAATAQRAKSKLARKSTQIARQVESDGDNPDWKQAWCFADGVRHMVSRDGEGVVRYYEYSDKRDVYPTYYYSSEGVLALVRVRTYSKKHGEDAFRDFYVADRDGEAALVKGRTNLRGVKVPEIATPLVTSPIAHFSNICAGQEIYTPEGC